MDTAERVGELVDDGRGVGQGCEIEPAYLGAAPGRLDSGCALAGAAFVLVPVMSTSWRPRAKAAASPIPESEG
jgi:hypothetical protein